MDTLETSQTLWEGFDPTAENLDVNVMTETEHDGIVTKQLYFTGRTADKGASRVLATVCYKSTVKNAQAVLVIDDFTKDTPTQPLVDLAGQGFVAMAIDYCGAKEKGLYTLYPEELSYCNGSASIFDIRATAKETKLYEYALNSMRAVTYLLCEEHATGVSLLAAKGGVDVAAIVLGVDARVGRSALLFGNLYREYPRPLADDADSDDADDELSRHVAYDTVSQIYSLGLAPQTYLLQTKAPLYVVVTANSASGGIRETSKTFLRLNDDSKLLIFPTCVDYLPSHYTPSVIAWIKGGTADIDTEVKSFVDGNGEYNLKVAKVTTLENTSMWYCVNPTGHAKYWRRATLVEGDDCYCAKIDLYEKNCTVLAFALFEGAIACSTPVLEEVAFATNVKKASGIIFSGATNQTLVSLSPTGEWWNVPLEPIRFRGALNIVGAKGKALATFAINDKAFQQNPTFTISFDLCGHAKQRVTLLAVVKFGDVNELYSVHEALVSDKWERITCEMSQFRRVTDGKQLADNHSVGMIAAVSEDEFIVNNVLLV